MKMITIIEKAWSKDNLNSHPQMMTQILIILIKDELLNISRIEILMKKITTKGIVRSNQCSK